MKKWVILIIVIAVLGLGLSYRQNAVERAAANLIADAYRGDLTAVKNDVEDGAPLDYTLLFDDDERQYKGADFTALHAAADIARSKSLPGPAWNTKSPVFNSNALANEAANKKIQNKIFLIKIL